LTPDASAFGKEAGYLERDVSVQGSTGGVVDGAERQDAPAVSLAITVIIVTTASGSCPKSALV
jgi:hypothetical protein